MLSRLVGSNPTYSAILLMPMLTVSGPEQDQRDTVMRKVVEAIETNVRILLPAFDRNAEDVGAEFALARIIPNPYGGVIGPYRYQFEGEEDLLHLIVARSDDGVLTPEEGQDVANFLLNGVPSGLIWLKPGQRTQHFYVGHDDLLDSLVR
ncbi:MAG: hypothetical protein JSS72_01050 [Armatimonadetes bacterium]|nr:hypothetical protein [Armatimonadota bacterium]